MVSLGIQIIWLFVLALPVAAITWTVTHEEVFEEPRSYCLLQSQSSRRLLQRKFFFVFTCEYCFRPLCDLFLPMAHSLQAAVRRLARLPHRRLRPGLGGKPIYELIRSFATRHPQRTSGDQAGRTESGTERTGKKTRLRPQDSAHVRSRRFSTLAHCKSVK